jgi:uncharacterized membrane protein
MATLKTNTLTGTSTAGSIAVTGEGNSTTTNLQQGLAKLFVRIHANGTTALDSFNVSSVDDDGTGDYGVNIANDMASANYTVTTAVTTSDNTTVNATCEVDPGDNITSGMFDLETSYVNATNNRTLFDYSSNATVHGDLA